MANNRVLVAACALALVGCDAGGARTVQSSVVPERVRSAVDRGSVNRAELIDFVIGLQLREESRLPNLFGELASVGHATPTFLTAAEFGDRFGSTSTDYEQLVAWLGANGLTVLRTSPARTTLTVRGTADAIERAFGTSIHVYEDYAGAFRSPAAELALPTSFAGLIAGVVGLDTARRWYSHAYPVSNAAGQAYGPPDLQAQYNSTTVTSPGKGETVAILGAGLAPVPADVDTFLSQYQMGPLAAGQYTQQFVGGPNRDDPASAMNEQFENVLDIDMVLAMAPSASVVHVITATNTPGLFTDGISYIVNQLPNAHAVSVSYGSCERGAAGEMPVVNALLAQAKAQGQQWFFAAGDSGSDGCRDGSGNRIISAGWPASSPYAVGVGGTQVTTGSTESAWGGNGGGGGGQSESLAKPAFQTGVGPYASDGSRDEPDVAALAGAPGVNTSAGGAEGTSAAAPMWAGVWALLDQAQGGHGLPTGVESLYTLGAAKQGFHDITKGTNGDGTTPGYPAMAGYDCATGWGSPNVAALIQNWR